MHILFRYTRFSILGLVLILIPTLTTIAQTPRDITFTVNTTSDDLDATNNGICATAGGQCSLRAAIQEANNLAGSDGLVIIEFSIGSGVQVITPINQGGSLPGINYPVFIDGTTQPGYAGSPLIVIEGGVYIAGGDSTVLGLSLETLHLVNLNNNVVQGNYLGVGPDGVTDVSGYNDIVLINESDNNLVGGPNAADRNIIAGGEIDGITIQNDSNNNTIQGNYIGIGADGTTVIGNASPGIILSSHNNTIIDNIIGGSGTHGIEMSGSSNVISGNAIGTDFAGTANFANARDGISMLSAFSVDDNSINGNLIANNGWDGISFGLDGAGNTFSQNRIFNNAQEGIDLNDDGVTANDAADSDSGSNNLQNFPVITSLSVSSGSVTIGGTLNSLASQSFEVEFFANSACDGTGHGEGEFYLGTTTVSTDSGGSASFSLTLANPSGELVITTTATASDGSTSEFSECFTFNLLSNPGFETAGGSNSQAADWDSTLAGDKRKCNKDKDGDGIPDKIVAHAGNCALQLKGIPGTSSKTQQSVDPQGSSGATMTFGAWFNGKNLVSGYKAQTKVKYSDGTKTKIQLSIPTGTFAYTEISDSETLTGTPNKIKVMLSMKGTSGKLFVDDASLTLAGGSLIPLPAVSSSLQTR